MYLGTKDGLNSKLHAVCDGGGRPVAMLLPAGQVSDYKGIAQLPDDLPEDKELLAGRGYDANWIQKALQYRGITSCIPPKRNRKEQIDYDKNLYKQRRKIEIMFGRLKGWHRIVMGYDRCAHTFFSVICIAASVIFF